MAPSPKPPPVPSSPPGTGADNKRAVTRHEKSVPVWFTYENEERDGVTRNMSLGGMYVVTADPPPFGASVFVRFRLPGLKEESRVKGQVRWIDGEGMGVQFEALRAIEVWALNQLFKRE